MNMQLYQIKNTVFLKTDTRRELFPPPQLSQFLDEILSELLYDLRFIFSNGEAPNFFPRKSYIPSFIIFTHHKDAIFSKIILRIVLELASSSKPSSDSLDPKHGSSMGFLSSSFSEKRRERKEGRERGE